MQGSGRARTSWRVLWQAVALFGIVAGDGVLLYALGAPVAFASLYLILAAALAAARIWLGRPAGAGCGPAPEESEDPPARRAVGYVHVRDEADGDLAQQSRAITECSGRRALDLTRIVHDAGTDGSGGDHNCPGLAWALEQIAAGKAEVLVVARLRDLSANGANLPPLLRWFNEPGRDLIALDLKLDTSTEAGRRAALAGVGGWGHERLSGRTRRGLEAARAHGGSQGRTAVADVPELHERIAAMREQGMTLQAIADKLNEDGVPTLRGGAMWRPSSVQRATGYRRPSNRSRGIELPKAGPNGGHGA